MNASHRPFAALTTTVALALGALLPGAQAQPAAGAPPSDTSIAACERAAREALAPRGAARADVTFDAPPTVQETLANTGHTVLRGAGRWRSTGGPRAFTYSCNVDPGSGDAKGVVVRDAAPRPAVARRTAEPDLSHVSPAACESRAAVALKQRWPRVSQISFDSATRRLLQEVDNRAELRGQGRALPAPDAPFVHFGFECAFDPRNGQVLSTRISGD